MFSGAQNQKERITFSLGDCKLPKGRPGINEIKVKLKIEF